MKELEGKVAIVTGGARGIGAAAVEALSEEGAFVFVTDVRLPGVSSRGMASRISCPLW